MHHNADDRDTEYLETIRPRRLARGLAHPTQHGEDLTMTYADVFPPIEGYAWDVRVTANSRFYAMLSRSPRGRSYTTATAVELENGRWEVTVFDTGVRAFFPRSR